MKSSRMLKVIEVSEERKDKNGMVYKNFKFTTPSVSRTIDEDTGDVVKVKMKPRVSSINLFKHNYLELSQLRDSLGLEDFKKIPKDALETIKADWGYDLEVGYQVQGDIVSRKVEAYEIQSENGTRVTNIYSTIVIGNTNDAGFEAAVIQTFARNGHIIIDQNTTVPVLNQSAVEEQEEVFN